MKDKKRIEILLKIIEKIYSKNPEMLESVDSVMVGVCAEEGDYSGYMKKEESF